MRFLSSWSTEAAGSTYSKARYCISSAFERKGDQQQTVLSSRDFFCPQVSQPIAEKRAERPASLHLPAAHHPPPPYATMRPQSLCQGLGASPLASPRYNSLPNLKGLVYEQGGAGTWAYQSHPRDEEKRLAYTRG